jgi:hypothetical protein
MLSAGSIELLCGSAKRRFGPKMVELIGRKSFPAPGKTYRPPYLRCFVSLLFSVHILWHIACSLHILH